MGQRAIGLLWGIRPADIRVRRAMDTLVDQYGADHRYADTPDQESEDGVALVGFWIAVGNEGGDHSEPRLGTVALADLETRRPYAARVAAAKERWTAFDIWVQSTGVTLPAPGLWIAGTEVA